MFQPYAIGVLCIRSEHNTLPTESKSAVAKLRPTMLRAHRSCTDCQKRRFASELERKVDIRKSWYFRKSSPEEVKNPAQVRCLVVAGVTQQRPFDYYPAGRSMLENVEIICTVRAKAQVALSLPLTYICPVGQVLARRLIHGRPRSCRLCLCYHLRRPKHNSSKKKIIYSSCRRR